MGRLKSPCPKRNCQLGHCNYQLSLPPLLSSRQVLKLQRQLWNTTCLFVLVRFAMDSYFLCRINLSERHANGKSYNFWNHVRNYWTNQSQKLQRIHYVLLYRYHMSVICNLDEINLTNLGIFFNPFSKKGRETRSVFVALGKKSIARAFLGGGILVTQWNFGSALSQRKISWSEAYICKRRHYFN